MTRYGRSSIMIAEDDPDDRFLIKKAFEKIKHDLEIHFVNDGEALLSFLDRSHSTSLPDLIILDLNMPKVNGHQALMEIRRKDAFNSIDIVVLSTSIEDKDIEFCKSNGIKAFYIKPASFESLVQIARSIIEG
jgi:CheY-like chemotaxis protein